MSTKNNKIKIKSTRKRRNRSQRRRKNRKAYTIRGGSCFGCFRRRTPSPSPPPPPPPPPMDPTHGYMKIIQDPLASADDKNVAMRALNDYLAQAHNTELEEMQQTASAAGRDADKVIKAVADLGAPRSSHIKPPHIRPPHIRRPPHRPRTPPIAALPNNK